MKFIQLTTVKGKEVLIKKTSILGIEEGRNCSIIHFNGMTIKVAESPEEIDYMINE